MRKGITPIIAIIVLLLITVALAGAAWTYLSSFWTGITARNIEVTDAFCVERKNATVFIRNSGTQSIEVRDITVINTTSGSSPSPQFWFEISNDNEVTTISPSQVVRYKTECGIGAFCSLRFIAWSRSVPVSVQC
jgi:flagellin-like protein